MSDCPRKDIANTNIAVRGVVDELLENGANADEIAQNFSKQIDKIIKGEEVASFSEFGENYAKEKLEENLLDFADLEHFALKVLQDATVQEYSRD